MPCDRSDRYPSALALDIGEPWKISLAKELRASGLGIDLKRPCRSDVARLLSGDNQKSGHPAVAGLNWT